MNIEIEIETVWWLNYYAVENWLSVPNLSAPLTLLNVTFSEHLMSFLRQL